MSIFALPLIQFQIPGGLVAGDEMSDIIALAIKEFEGKLRADANVKAETVVGDLATLAASGGKDMYLARAHASIRNVGGANAQFIEVVLKVNNVIKDRWYTSNSKNTNQGGHMGNDYEFAVGFKVTENLVIKLEVITASDDIEISGNIECFEEDTGASPQIPPLNPV